MSLEPCPLQRYFALACLLFAASWSGIAHSSPLLGGDARGAASRPPAPSPAQQWIGPENLHAVAAQALTDALAGRADRIQVGMPRYGASGVIVGAGPAELVARGPALDLHWRPRVTVWVDVLQSGVVTKSVLVPLELQAFQSGWVALQELPAGTRLTRALLRSEEIELTASGTPAWHGDPAGQLLRSRVRAGRYVGESQVVAAPAVARGDRVVLVHRFGGVEVLAAASAMQDGNPGQKVQVRVDAAQGAVMARVVEVGKVELLK